MVLGQVKQRIAGTPVVRAPAHVADHRGGPAVIVGAGNTCTQTGGSQAAGHQRRRGKRCGDLLHAGIFRFGGFARIGQMPYSRQSACPGMRAIFAVAAAQLRVLDQSAPLEGVGAGRFADRGLRPLIGRLAVWAQQSHRIQQDVANSPVCGVCPRREVILAAAIAASEMMSHQGADQIPELGRIHGANGRTRVGRTTPRGRVLEAAELCCSSRVETEDPDLG